MKQKQHCIPCEGGIAPLSPAEIQEYLTDYPEWIVKNNPTRIIRTFIFKKFVQAIGFVNTLADIAESEGHHPNMLIEYNKVTIELYTHAINGLSTNDFILASLVDEIWSSMKHINTMDTFTTLQSLKNHAFTFVDERNWHQHHNLRNLSMSIAIEASELMELFLWKQDKEADKQMENHGQEIAQELSDVLFGILNFANRAQIDIADVFLKKLEKLKIKYPIKKELE